MPKRKKRAISKKKKDDSPDEVSECESLDRPPSAKKVAAASSTSQLDDEDQISICSTIVLHNTSLGSGDQTLLLCNFCSYTAETKVELGTHVRQHMNKCLHCSFSSFSRVEVSRHCKYEHDKDIDGITSEVDSSSTECEMDKDPCSACVFCSFMTYSTEHLEKHTAHKHPGMLAKSVAKMISKQISANVRKDDYLFYLVISNESSAGLGNSSSATEKSSEPILIDVSVEKTEDVKPEVKETPDTKSFQQKVQFDINTLSDMPLGEKIGNRDKSISSTLMSAPVKVETMYCLTCPYSNVYIEKLKCHTIVQHPVGAAAATYNATGESSDPQDVTFFCVREDCSHSSSDCTTYQKHLMDCCACQKTLKVLERERLRSTITFIVEHHRKYKISALDGFFDFASPFLGVSLPPNLTGISSFRAVETSSTNQAKTERSNSPQSSVSNIEKTPSQSSVSNIENTPSESSQLNTSFSYKTPSKLLTYTVVSSSGSISSGTCAADVNHSFFPHQLQDITSNIHLAGSSTGSYESKTYNSPDPANIQIQVSSTNVPTEGRTSQPEQYHNVSTEGRTSQPEQYHNTQASVPFHTQNQRGFPQPSHNIQRSYQETPQMNVSWASSNGREATSMVSAQSQQNFNMAFHNEPVEVGSRILLQDNIHCSAPVSQSKPSLLQDNIHCSAPVSQSKPSLLPEVEEDHNFSPLPAPQNNYAPNYRHGSFDSVNTKHLNANMEQNLGVEHHEASASMVPNTMTNLQFYGRQQPSNIFNTSDVDTSNLETQPQPKMMDLLSDSYSILLSDEYGPEGQIQELGANSLNQPQHTPICPPSYHQTPVLNAQSQVVVSQSSPSLMPQGHSLVYQPMQHEEQNFQQPHVDNSLILSHGNQFSFPPSNHGNQMVNVMPNLGPDPGSQAAQASSSYGAVQSTLTPELACKQPAPHQPPNVPNFLVASGGQSSEAAPAQQYGTSSFFHPRPNAHIQRLPYTPPKNNNTVNRFAGASPLSPSIYLSGHSPRHRRSNWTDADMRPRGMMLPAVPPRNMAPVSAPGTKSNVNQRLFAPGRRGYPRPPRMPSGRGRMPAPRMPNSRVNDDDDVILTAVTRVHPPGNQHPYQQTGGRLASRGSSSAVSQGRGHASPVPSKNRQMGPVPGVRMPYPAAPQLNQPPKQFDISKHFEDLACVVNASADEVGNDNDIEIVCVTPGDKDKPNNSKAVDASKFSFCCVHCGKDQGSKQVMKQHMKARHNDSLLGAFTNTETGQLLFFCPQLTCEFMTYEEKRLCEHLSKCFDLDRSKPFDFGTAIKNLKSLKIRQLDVRTMGRSQDNPIDLDGQGMKDNFSSSLNDAFGDIVVNASGRHIVRNATPPYQTPPPPVRPSPMPPNMGAMRNKIPFRNQAHSSTGPRLRLPGFTERADMANRLSRPVTTFRHPQHQNPEMRASGRQPAPTNIRMNSPNVKDIHSRTSASFEHHQPQLQRGAAPSHASSPRQPSGDRHEAVVIVIDADSPEGPDEMEQSDYVLSERHQLSNQTPTRVSDVIISESLPAKRNQDILQSAETINTNASQKQCSVSGNQDFNQSNVTSPGWNPSSHLPRDYSTSRNRMTNVQSSTFFSQSIHHSYDTMAGSNTDDSDFDQSNPQMQQNNVRSSHTFSCPTSGLTSISSFQEDIRAAKTTTLDSNASTSPNLASDRIKLNTSSYSTDSASLPTYTLAGSSDPQITKCSTNISSDITTSLSSTLTPLAASLPPTSAHLNTVPMAEYFDEEERVNAVVLEKVFAKVPNMPKNLSRRLVAKFKEYANYRGVKITSDSKVIDEFVSKIYYKGSTADKGANKTQPVVHSSSVHHGGNSEDSLIENSAASLVPGNSVAKEAEVEYVSSRELIEDHRQEESIQEDVTLKEKAREQQTVVSEVQPAENDVIATQVILAQTSLQFSPTFASIALKSLSTAKKFESYQDLTLDQLEPTTNQVTEQQLARSFQPGIVRELISPVSRRNSASDARMSKVANPVRRSSSFPLPVPSVISCSETVQSSDQQLPEEMVMDAPSPDSLPLNLSLDSKSSPPVPEVYIPNKMEPQQDYQLISNEESKMYTPPSPPSTIFPILISSVEDVVSRHPALENDIAGSPYKEEPFGEGIKELDVECQNTAQDANKDNNQVIPKKVKRFGIIKHSKFPDIIDKKTGMLLLKKTKRARPRKPFINREETLEAIKEAEIKDLTAEEHVIRRSSRSRKPVNKDYQGETNEMDDLMSDDDDEYNIDDDDDGTDTDSEWHGGGNSEQQQPPKKRIKKIIPPPDPTAFDVSTKGKFKCWQCRKVFSRCSFAKSHMTQKHEAGLCIIHLDKSEELNTLCLLLFCPRKCKYVTQSLEGMRSHMESCAQPVLQDGEKYLEISKHFLESTCSELQGMSLEEMLNKTRTRKPRDPNKPRDPTQPVKAKKPKLKEDKSNMDPVILKFIKTSAGGEAGNVLVSSVVSHSSSSHAAAVTSTSTNQTASSGRAYFHEDQPSQMQQSVSSIILTDPERSSQPKTQYPRNTPQKIITHAQVHYSATAVGPEGTGPHFSHMASNLAVSAASSFPNPPRQHIFAAGKQTHADSHFSQHLALPHVTATNSPMHDDDIVYVID